MPISITTTASEAYQGFGAVNTTGGEGGSVLTVTNLNDSGAGSLRAACEATGSRIIQFDVEGKITLSSEIELRGDVTIEGDTAPGDGVVLTGNRMQVVESNCIIKGLKFRPSDGAAGLDGISLGNSTGGTRISNIIIDHCSVSFATDENMAMWGPVDDVTVSNCLIASSLDNGEGATYGFLIAPGPTGTADRNNRISLIGNYFAHNLDRNPTVRDVNDFELVNNYAYNFGTNGTRFYDEVLANVIGNVWERGNDSTANRSHLYLDANGDPSSYYLSDNIGLALNGSTEYTGNAIAHTDTGLIAGSPVFSSTVAAPLSSSAVKASVLANAGARPDNRDAIDAWIVASATEADRVNDGGDAVDTQAQWNAMSGVTF